MQLPPGASTTRSQEWIRQCEQQTHTKEEPPLPVGRGLSAWPSRVGWSWVVCKATALAPGAKAAIPITAEEARRRAADLGRAEPLVLAARQALAARAAAARAALAAPAGKPLAA